jgi:hypothetical protein
MWIGNYVTITLVVRSAHLFKNNINSEHEKTFFNHIWTKNVLW